MLVDDVALDTLLIKALNQKVANVQPIRKGKSHAAYQLRAQLIAQRREHLKLLYPAGLQRRIKVKSLNDVLLDSQDEADGTGTPEGMQ